MTYENKIYEALSEITDILGHSLTTLPFPMGTAVQEDKLNPIHAFRVHDSEAFLEVPFILHGGTVATISVRVGAGKMSSTAFGVKVDLSFAGDLSPAEAFQISKEHTRVVEMALDVEASLHRHFKNFEDKELFKQRFDETLKTFGSQASQSRKKVMNSYGS